MYGKDTSKLYELMILQAPRLFCICEKDVQVTFHRKFNIRVIFLKFFIAHFSVLHQMQYYYTGFVYY